MRVIYFTPNFNLDKGSPGVRRKIAGQVSALDKAGFATRCLGFASEPKIPQWCLKNRGPVWRLATLPFRAVAICHAFHRWAKQEFINLEDQVAETRPGCLYIRMNPLTTHYLVYSLWRLQRKGCRPSRILLEIATWPYDLELSAAHFTTWTDRVFRRLYRTMVDRIVTFTDLPRILGVPTIRTRNGIDVAALALSDPDSFDGRTLKLIAVSNLYPWNGYDRLLRGFAAYAPAEDDFEVTLTIVGKGRILEELQDLSQQLGITDRVRFSGQMEGEELDREYAQAQVAIGNLAIHRKGLQTNPDLKNREYCARGLPFVTSSRDDAFPADFPFISLVAADEQPIDIRHIVDFFLDIRKNRPDYQQQMREHAAKHLDWSILMQPVADYLQGGCSGA